MTDPIADMLTRVRNALSVKKNDVVVPFSKIKIEIIKILLKEGFIGSYQVTEEKYPQIKVMLKYQTGAQPAIESLKRISKPGRRVYAAKDNLPKVLNNLGVAILSTSEGIMTNREAWKRKIGGEVLCEIY